MRFFITSISLLGAYLFIAGCSGLPSANTDHDEVAQNPTQTLYYQPTLFTRDEKQFHYRQIPADTLFSLLIAETAGQRQDYKTALATYLHQAKETQDPGLAERTVNIALFVGSQAYALAGLKIWLEVEPQNPMAQQTAAQVLIETGNFKQALIHIKKLQELTGVSQYDYWATQLANIPQPMLQELLADLHQIKLEQPGNASLWYAEGLLLLHLGKNDLALECIDESLKLRPDFLAAALQKARVLVVQKRPNEALEWLQKLNKKHPQRKSIQVLSGRILLEQHRFQAAHDTFEQLHQNFPEDSAILLSLALIKEELGQREDAKNTFYQLLATEGHVSEAHFYLARLADEEGDNDTAIEHFQQVIPPSREFLAAQVRLSQLLKEQQGMEDALNFLTEQIMQYPEFKAELTSVEIDLLINAKLYRQAMHKLNLLLEAQPENLELLYGRAMLADKMEDLKALERDLRRMLELKPDSVEALNALGYTLADKTQRYQEALVLVQQAYELDPQSPAILDSLGWVYFRLGEYQQALPLLEAAFAKVGDHEIAAHLGELYWQLGRHQEARQVWQQGLEHDTNSPVIHSTLKRLKVTLENASAP